MDVEDDQEKNEKAKEKLTKAREAGIFFVQVFNEHFPGSTTDKRAFAAAIGWDPDVIGLLWTEYGAVFAAAEVHPLDLLCTFSWCKLYLTWPVMSLLWGVTRTKLANKVTFTLKLLYTNLDEVRRQFRLKMILLSLTYRLLRRSSPNSDTIIRVRRRESLKVVLSS